MYFWIVFSEGPYREHVKVPNYGLFPQVERYVEKSPTFSFYNIVQCTYPQSKRCTGITVFFSVHFLLYKNKNWFWPNLFLDRNTSMSSRALTMGSKQKVNKYTSNKTEIRWFSATMTHDPPPHNIIEKVFFYVFQVITK